MRFNPPTLLRRMFCLVSLLAISAWAHASDCPDRPIRVDHAIDRKPGGNSVIGMGAAVNAQPDGSSLVLTANTIEAINPLVDSRLPNDPEKILPPAVVGRSPFVLIPGQLNVNPVAELFALLKAWPGAIVDSLKVCLA